jgi:hypothetical protein
VARLKKSAPAIRMSSGPPTSPSSGSGRNEPARGLRAPLYWKRRTPLSPRWLVAPHGEDARYLPESSRLSFHRGEVAAAYRTNRFCPVTPPPYSNQGNVLLLSTTPSSRKPVRPVRHRPNLGISLTFLANRSGRSPVRLGYAKGQFGSPSAGSGLLGAPRCCPANRPAHGTRSVLVRLHRYPLALLLPEQAGRTIEALPDYRSCRHNNRYREPPCYL